MRLYRLRAGEWLTAASVVLMIVALFGLTWYGASSGPSGSTSASNGWNGATHLHWLLALAILAGLAVVLTQAAFRAPGIPVSVDVIATVIAIVTVLWLIFRVVIDAPPHQMAGAWLELVGGLGLLVGSFLAMRQEGIAERDGPGEIPAVEVTAPSAG